MYLLASGLNDLPVNRIALDDGMLETLAGEINGLTVVRCEEVRHSFLKPLADTGAVFFWVWPVIVAERLEAILAVGYREVPVADPVVAHCGGKFAQRLAVALSMSARDERLYRQAHYDPLTALPNRLLFRDRLAQELANAVAGLSRGALLYIDLDHFKRVNDSVGHTAGDQLLTIVAQRLRSCIKDGDTVARLGGDEFTVILRNVVNPDAACAVASRIIESLQLPVNIAGRDCYVCASIGITLFPDDATTIEDLMRNADTAMYRAKDLGRGRMMFFDVNMTNKPPLPTVTGLQHALRGREFSLFYQPQFGIAEGELVGVEALLRWQTPRDGMRHPEELYRRRRRAASLLTLAAGCSMRPARSWQAGASSSSRRRASRSMCQHSSSNTPSFRSSCAARSTSTTCRRRFWKSSSPRACSPTQLRVPRSCGLRSSAYIWHWMILAPAIPRSPICVNIRSTP